MLHILIWLTSDKDKFFYFMKFCEIEMYLAIKICICYNAIRQKSNDESIWTKERIPRP